MKKIVLILSFTVLALTARGQSVVFDNLEPYCFGAGRHYEIGNFNSCSEATAGPFVAQVSGNLAAIDVAVGVLQDQRTGQLYAGPMSVYLSNNAGPPEAPTPGRDRTLLGYVTPVTPLMLFANLSDPFGCSYPLSGSIVSISVTGTVPVTAGTIYFLILENGPRVGNQCDGTSGACVFDIWGGGPMGIPNPDTGLGVAYVSGNDVTMFPNGTWVNNRSVLPAFRITANTYNAQVQPPINVDGTSIFNAKRGVVAVRFTLTYGGVATCTLPPATIAVTRTAGGVTAQVNESVYTASADTGSNFRISGCQYTYNLDSRALGVGVYRLDSLINGQVVGSAAFELR